MISRPAVHRAAYTAALVCLFAFTVLFRFLQLKDGFPNDHFVFIAGGQQILAGEWPTRDFLDQGLPLMFVASAAMQKLLGPPLFAEAVLIALAFAAAAVLTAAAVRELTGSRVLAILAAVVEVAIVTRSYGYHKVLAYAAGFYLLQRYVTRPTNARLLALAVGIVAAFLLRHDHGIYLGIGGAIAAWLAQDAEQRGGARRAATLVGLCALLAAPYLIYVQMNGGLWAYIRVGLEFRDGELSRQPHVWPSLFGSLPYHAALVYEYWAIPCAAALVLFLQRRRDDFRSLAARVAPVIVVSSLVTWTLVRDPLITRLHDAIAPAVTLGPWLAVCTWHARHQWLGRPAAALGILLFALTVLQVGSTIEQLDRASLLVTWRRLPEFVSEVSDGLRSDGERQMSSRTAHVLRPFYSYIARCTAPDHRLLIGGFAPEVSVFARRPFAGGQSTFVQGYYQHDIYQRRVLERLTRQVVPFVILPGDAAANQFRSGFSLVAGYVGIRYVPLATLGGDDPSTAVQVLFDSALPVAARDPETGWPCETANEWTIYARGAR